MVCRNLHKMFERQTAESLCAPLSLERSLHLMMQLCLGLKEPTMALAKLSGDNLILMSCTLLGLHTL